MFVKHKHTKKKKNKHNQIHNKKKKNWGNCSNMLLEILSKYCNRKYYNTTEGSKGIEDIGRANSPMLHSNKNNRNTKHTHSGVTGISTQIQNVLKHFKKA